MISEERLNELFPLDDEDSEDHPVLAVLRHKPPSMMEQLLAGLAGLERREDDE
jgi:hypothetical protein